MRFGGAPLLDGPQMNPFSSGFMLARILPGCPGSAHIKKILCACCCISICLVMGLGLAVGFPQILAQLIVNG
jgi:hypothetical protein